MLRIRRRREAKVQFRFEKLGPTFKKSMPACDVCGYDADWLIRVGEADAEGSLERMFCDLDLRDALLDAINFNCRVPDTFEAA